MWRADGRGRSRVTLRQTRRARLIWMSVFGPQLPAAECVQSHDPALSQQVSAEFRWQALRMPPLSRQLLIERHPPSEVDPEMLLAELGMSVTAAAQVRQAFNMSGDSALLHVKALLPPEGCKRLRDSVDANMQRKVDTVDGSPDYQLNLNREELVVAIGPTASEALWRLPLVFSGQGGRAATRSTYSNGEPEIFVRRYMSSTRPWNPFHTDSSALTINVALDEDGSYAGGELLGCYARRVHVIQRGQGDATAHSSRLLHGVAQMTSGVRHSLIVFIGRVAAELPADLVFDASTRQLEAYALASLMSNEDFLAHCGTLLGGTGQVLAMQAQYARVQARCVAPGGIDGHDRREGTVGASIERVVQHYAAPHLRPTSIDERLQQGQADAACWSLRALLAYCERDE